MLIREGPAPERFEVGGIEPDGFFPGIEKRREGTLRLGELTKLGAGGPQVIQGQSALAAVFGVLRIGGTEGLSATQRFAKRDQDLGRPSLSGRGSRRGGRN